MFLLADKYPAITAKIGGKAPVVLTISFIILSLEYTIMLAPLIIEISIMYTIYSTYRYGGNVQSSPAGKYKTAIVDVAVLTAW